MHTEAVLTPVTAMIGAANADATAAERPVVFPLPSSGPDASTAARALADAAARRGARGARPFGHPGAPPWHLPEVVHSALGAVAAVLGALGITAGLWLTIAVLLLCAARVFGLSNPLMPRRAAWSVVVGPLRAPSARVLACVVDRERVSPQLPRIVLGGLCVALASEGFGPSSAVAAAVGLGIVGGWAALLRSPVGVSAASPEGDAADAVVRHVAAHPEVPAVLGGASAATASGILAALDWHDVPIETTVVELVGAPLLVEPAARVLKRRGWNVRIVAPDELRRMG